MAKLFISTPCYDAMVTMQYTISILNLLNLLKEKNIEFVIDFIGNESLIPRARNKSLFNFKKSGFTHMLFIDSDLQFPAQAVIDLIEFDKDVACCTYPKKGFNWNRFFYSVNVEKDSKESPESRGLDFAMNLESDTDGKPIKKDNFVKAKHASTGFMMIKKEIVDKLYEKHEELQIISDDLSQNNELMVGLFCCMIKNKQYLSEDYSFCERVTDIGGEVWINVEHNLSHIGKYIFNGDIKNRDKLLRTREERSFY